MRFFQRFLRLGLVLTLCMPAVSATGQTGMERNSAIDVASTPAERMGFDAYVQLLSARARAQGVSEPTIARMTAGLTPNSRIIALDRNQPGQTTTSGYASMAGYLSRHINRSLIERGRTVKSSLGPMAQRIEGEYGVPAQMMVAIFGHETSYGSYTGDFDLARSLATLAWEGRRRELFANEFIALLKLADRGIPRSRLTGSWAGAMGNPQFLPSVYLRLAVDEDGDGTSDIWSSRADTIASIANYFRDAGWRPGEPWGVSASIPASFDFSSVETRLVSPVCSRVHERHSRWMTVGEWRELGVIPRAPIADNVQASLFQPDGPGKNAYLLTGNYRVILEYNCSNYYALSVGLLADEIAR